MNYTNTVAGLIFPIVTFPYAARILMPDGIGVVNFQNSIIGYIVLLTSLGIPLYAVREIAKCRNDIELRNRTTVEIAILSVFLSLIGYIVVWLMGEYVPRIHEEATLFYILSLSILFTSIGVLWFYQGIEDFKFITIVGLVVRFLCAICLFVFVKSPDDLLIYGLVIIGSTVGNNFVNFIHLRKYIQLSTIEWKKLNVRKHIRPSLRIFLLNVIISIYVQLNTIMLGFMTGDREVGLFTAGIKISHILTTVITSLGTVMLPRCAHLIGEKKFDEFNTIIQKSYHLLMFSAIPITVGIMLLAQPVIICFCGPDYSEAASVLVYTAPTIIFIGMTNIIGIQILYPYGKEMLVIYSTIVAAVINVLLNLLLIPLWAETGAAISTLISELCVLIVQFQWGNKYIPFRFIDNKIIIYSIATLLMMFGVLLCMLVDNPWCQIILSAVTGFIIYTIILYLKRDQLIQEISSYIFKH